MQKWNSFSRWIKYRIDEMGTDVEEKQNLKTIIQKLIQGDSAWMKEKDILVGDKGRFWILNYGVLDKNQYNKLVRGLVVEKPNYGFSGDVLSLIKSFPFTRFFNQGEKDHVDQIDLNNAEMLEKMDGTMVGVYFPDNDPKDPHWHTRKMLSSNQQDMDLEVGGFNGYQSKLMQLIGDYVKKLNFEKKDIAYTYVFEFIHHASAVLTKYSEEKYGLYLLFARNIQDHIEESEEELDKIASRIGAMRPNRWDSVADQNEIKRMMDSISNEIEDFEGFVFRDRKTGKRMKLKDPKYVEKHHMIGEISYSRLIPKVFDGEENEIISYFPHAKPMIEEIKKRHNELKKRIVNQISYYQKHKNLNRKELWQMMVDNNLDPTIKSFVMKYINSSNLDGDVDQALKSMAVYSYDKGKFEVKRATDKYMEMIGV